jgi:hypothetical protein
MTTNRALLFITIASLSFAWSGVVAHVLGDESWDVALLARAIFGLPFAIVAIGAGLMEGSNQSAGY